MDEGIALDVVIDEGVVERVNPPHGQARNGGRKRVAVELPEEPSTRRRSSARDILPIDDEKHQYFPCPVANCNAVYQNRSERSYHLRQDHPGYKYKIGDGLEKLRLPEIGQSIEEVAEEEVVEEEEHILDVETNVDVGNVDHKAATMSEDDHFDFSRDPSEEKYVQQMPEADDWNGSLAVQRFLENKSSGREIPDGITGGNFSREDEIYRTAVDRGPRRRGRPKNPPGAEPSEHSKVRIPDPTGKYRCYIPECDWRGGYRSIRADHMKFCHKDWKAPPRYILQRMSRDGLPFKEPEGEFACLVEGCPWRGNYRASRSSHMKSQHPDFQTEKKKAEKGGYCPDGKYLCHEQTCSWRGSSRSTRAAHMKREHPGYLNPMYQPKMLLCPDCNVQCCTHKTFVDHLVADHNIGGSVQREFTDIQDYEEWYEAVQDTFSVEFMKKMGVKQNEGYQVITYLYCARGRQKQVKTHPYNVAYMKNNNLTKPFRCRNHCAAFLRVLHWNDGRLTVVGCVEHTGHRLGTSILRLAPCEREILEEFIYVHDDQNPLEAMLEKFREMEDYVVEGYSVSPFKEDMLDNFILDEDERVSLNKLIQTYPPDSFFDVITEGSMMKDGIQPITLGIMTEEMKELWKQYGNRTVCFEEVRLVMANWNLFIIFVLAFVDDKTPRCCCVYLSNIGENRHTIFRKLQEINPQPPKVFISDIWQPWADCLESVYGEQAYNIEFAIGEWNLLIEWANSLDGIVRNRLDRFTIFAAMRRWLRVPDQALFDCYAVELFEAFRELDVEQMSEILDVHLSDPDFFKKWNPMTRSGLTDHSNPVVDIACRYFRDRYLNAESSQRIDQYVGLLMGRIVDFNKCEISEPVAQGTVEPPRSLPIYDVVEPERTILADGTVIDHTQAREDMILEEIDEGDVKYGIIQEYGYQEEVEAEEIVMDMEGLPEESLVLPSTSAVFYKDPMLGDQVMIPAYEGHPSSSQMMPTETIIVTETEDEKKNRVSMLMNTIQKNPVSLKNLLENGMSQIVDELDHHEETV